MYPFIAVCDGCGGFEESQSLRKEAAPLSGSPAADASVLLARQQQGECAVAGVGRFSLSVFWAPH